MAEIREFYNLAQIETEWGIARHVAKKYIEDGKVKAVKEPNARSRDGIQYQVRYEDVCTMKRLIQEEKEAKAQIHAEREERKKKELAEFDPAWFKAEFEDWSTERIVAGLPHTKKAFTDMLGVSQGMFTWYASGKCKPAFDKVAKMKRMFADPKKDFGEKAEEKVIVPFTEELVEAAKNTVLGEVIPEVKAEDKVFCITEEAYLKAIGNAYQRGIEFGMKLVGRISK